MAGINDSPNYYNPFGEEDKTEIINNKTKLVLGKMLEVKDENGVTKYIVFSHSFVPNIEKLREREIVDKMPYLSWAKQGYITVTNSQVVDQGAVWEYVTKFCIDNQLNIDTLCFDPANSSKMMMDLSNQGNKCVEVYQSHKSLNESTAGFREQVYEKNIIYTPNPVLNFAMKNAVVRQNNGLIKIDKDATRKRIDPVDSLLAAFKLAQYYEFVFDYNKYSDLVESIYE